MLTRLGNKKKMSEKLHMEFPKHKMRIELFFGAGGSFFNTPKAKYSILNDIDNDVTNLYLTLKNNKEILVKEIEILPISQGLINHWKKNQESDPVKKAIRFLLLSNFTYLGKGDTLRIGLDNSKKILLDQIEPTLKSLGNSKITNLDFREVIPKISFSKGILHKSESFVYMDPVYLDTEHYYNCPKWTEKDTKDCFEIMANSGIKCAMSEFKSEIIMDLASDYNMNIKELKDRPNIKSRATELLITNYSSRQTDLFKQNEKTTQKTH